MTVPDVTPVIPAFPTSPAYPLTAMPPPANPGFTVETSPNLNVLGGNDGYLNFDSYLDSEGRTTTYDLNDPVDLANAIYNGDSEYYPKRTYSDLPGTYPDMVTHTYTQYSYGYSTTMSYLTAMCDLSYYIAIAYAGSSADSIIANINGEPDNSDGVKHTLVYHTRYGSTQPPIYANDDSYVNGSLVLAQLSQYYSRHLTDLVLENATKVAAFTTYAASFYAAQVFNSIASLYNVQMAQIVQIYSLYAAQVNANPAYANPYVYAAAQAQALQTLVNTQLQAATAAINGVILAATTIVNNAKTGTVDPTLTTVTNTIAQQEAFVKAALAQYTKIATDTVTAVTAEVERQRLILQAEAERQVAAGTAIVSQKQAEAFAAIGAALAQAGAVVADGQKQIAALTTQGLAVVLNAVTQVQASLADRPLFHGALSEPIVVNSSTDVIVIPAGGLIVTAD